MFKIMIPGVVAACMLAAPSFATESLSLNFEKIKAATPNQSAQAGHVETQNTSSGGTQARSSKPKEIVVVGSQSQKPAGASIKADTPEPQPLLLPAIQSAREAARRTR